MDIVEKARKLPPEKKLIIIWAIITTIAVIFCFWRISNFRNRIESFTKDDWGITPNEDTINEIKKGSEAIKESTNAIKDGLEAIKDLSEDIKNFKDLNESDEKEFINEK